MRLPNADATNNPRRHQPHQHDQEPADLPILDRSAAEVSDAQVTQRQDHAHRRLDRGEMGPVHPAIHPAVHVVMGRDQAWGPEAPDKGGQAQADEERHRREGVAGDLARGPIDGRAHGFFSTGVGAGSPFAISSIRKATASSAAEITSR